MRDETKAAIVEHAKQTMPLECCGLVLVSKGKEIYFPCKNLSTEKNQFTLDPIDYEMAESIGDIVTVVHSHCYQSAKPSQADLVACEASGLPWLIVSVPTETFHYFEPSGYKAPLVGREFCHGVLDCYTLVQDWFKSERGVILPDFHRDVKWWENGQNIYLENFEKAGFKQIEIDKVEKGDCFLMQMMSKVPNHAAIYLGDDIILHHVQNRLSTREVYGGYYRKVTNKALRYYP
jgi:proteasome lid subunit RPN8/RPN11